MQLLKALKPDKFEDLIAMNALYGPGPMETSEFHRTEATARTHKYDREMEE